jgi:hypothetical protein
MKLKKNTSLDESAKAWLRRRFSSGDVDTMLNALNAGQFLFVAAGAERKNDSPVTPEAKTQHEGATL